MSQVRLERVWKTFRGGRGREVVAVREVSLEVAEGEFLTVVGPSGSGKTTLLRLIAGLERPSAGRIFFRGRDGTADPPERREVALVFQSGALFPHLDAFENLALPLRLRRTSTSVIAARVQEIACWLGLEQRLRQRPGELSGGERQRVALGRALVRRPALLLLDEPLAALDGPLRRQLRRELVALQRRLGLTILHVTHDQAEAFDLGQRVAVLHDGELQQVAEPRVLYEHPANLFVAGFLGGAPMNLIPGTLRREWGGPVFVAGDGGAGSLSLRLPPELVDRLGGPDRGAVTLGVRPEDLELAEAEGAPPAAGLRAEIEELEARAGGEAWVHVRLGAQRLVVRIGAGLELKPGDHVLVRLPLGRAHWFDGATGVALEGRVR